MSRTQLAHLVATASLLALASSQPGATTQDGVHHQTTVQVYLPDSGKPAQ